MSTLGDLINEVHLNLLGFVLDQEQLTVLATGCDSDDTTLTVADATLISNGLVEIDEELLYVTSVDQAANTATVLRAAYGTTAASHSSGVVVRNNPKVPRAAIQRAINATLTSSYPDLFAVATTEITIDNRAASYELPASAEELISVTYEETGGADWWPQVRRYRLKTDANTDEFPTGKTIEILEGLPPGQTLNVVYRKVPSEMTALADTLTGTGLNESARECIVYGACSRLVGYLEPARLTDDSAEARFIDSQSPGSALTAARYFYQMYLQARSEEVRRLQDRYPARPHFTR